MDFKTILTFFLASYRVICLTGSCPLQLIDFENSNSKISNTVTTVKNFNFKTNHMADTSSAANSASTALPDQISGPKPPPPSQPDPPPKSTTSNSDKNAPRLTSSLLNSSRHSTESQTVIG